MVVALTLAGVIHINPVKLARGTTYFIVGVAVIAVLFVASAMFWAGFEQAGSSLNLIAGLVAGEFGGDAVVQMPGRYFQIVLTTLGAGLVLLVLAKPIRSLMPGVK